MVGAFAPRTWAAKSPEVTPAFVRGLPGHPGGHADLPPRRAGVAGGFNGRIKATLLFEHPCHHVLDGAQGVTALVRLHDVPPLKESGGPDAWLWNECIRPAA